MIIENEKESTEKDESKPAITIYETYQNLPKEVREDFKLGV